MGRPFKVDKLGNVFDRETQQLCGYIFKDELEGIWAAVFSHIKDTEVYEEAWYQFEAEVGREPYAERGFWERLEAAQFLWETREFDRKSFPPAPLSNASRVRNCWAHAKSGKPRFTKFGTSWAVIGAAADVRPGETIEVYKRNGEMSTVELSDDVAESHTWFGVEVLTVKLKPRPRKPRSAGPRGPRSRRECPGCGEERGGGFFNGWSCRECGWGE
ncbi:Uncharacterised protein [Mycobacteroides abscessus subsp. massiliense]|uniref:hypothetical protein n=1 Tax=Mycobacteroides TaxID=670516 RepID=UPI000926F240|nr:MULTISPECIES: hypothetical protein [Mycobacteroides]MBV0918040.1 hypothetical protein [Mycobacteroides chelonae]RIT59380.1 hypothetical protein D2E95_09320 [Mycobacteroides abscessus]RIU52509.1 hypothetical protein D2F02_05705 [Mycobacteroides abscessus]SHX53918.1 Uncharacterised protein [Mycobacteroides abscessus subsp. abscessus]SKM75892.1 Uncharacterised protein [Mycobacteroides abscessus subsp. massiliense]